jgi:hypothetical protein
MNRSLCLVSVFCIFAASAAVSAQESRTSSAGITQGPIRRALIININARVLEEQTVIWNETHQKITIPGSPVGIQLVGSNVVVSVQFTPFVRRRGDNVLVAQGQIWITDPDRGVSYYTSIQTIPMEFDEPIHFFPLGASQQLSSSIEIILTVSLYSGPGVNAEEAAASTGDDR